MTKKLAAFLVASTCALGCPGSQPPATAPQNTAGSAPQPSEPVVVRLSKTGLGFRLSDADAEESGPPVKVAATAPLGAEGTKRLLDRLPPLKGDAEDTKQFALRGKSIPAPRPGETIKEAFPPPASHGAPPSVAAGPLRVTRHEPDGPVKLAPYLTVTFSQPMVPIDSHDDLSKLPMPVRLAPQPPGKWRWVGTQTAMFQPERRFPMATDYTVDIDAATKSAAGAAIDRAQHFAFSTPPPKLLDHGPTGSAERLDPVIYARFDQAVDVQALLATMVVKQNGKPVPVRLATAEERDADETVVRLSEEREDDGPMWLGIGDHLGTAGGQYTGGAAPGRLIAVKPTAPFTTASAIEVDFPAGTPSAEGPKKTPSGQAFSFQTYGPLRVTDHRCYDCNPFSAFTITFTNTLDLAKFDKRFVTVTPPIADMKTTVSGSWLTISGRKKGRTKYAVTLSPEIADEFGQTMDRSDSHVFDVGPAASVLFSEEQPMAVLDPASTKPALSIYTVNEPAVHVRLFSVKPADFPAYATWRTDWDYEGKSTRIPGALVVDRVVRPEPKPDELVETAIDLGPLLHDGFGQVLAIVESTRPFRDRWRKEWVRQWLQVTHLGLQGVADTSDLVAWTTELANAAPLGGVLVSQGGSAATSGADGLARLSAGAGAALIAAKGSDLTFLPGGVRVSDYRPDPTHLFTFDDRKMYKPGEEVHVKGWGRRIGREKGGDVSLLPDSAKKTVHWVASDPRGAELSKGDAPMDALGGFDFVVTTPKNANLGEANVRLELDGVAVGTHTFQIQEFRRPEFEVRASTSEGSFFVGQHAVATVDAKYYAGGGLPNADVTWTVTRSDGTFHPPNRDEYLFGKNEIVYPRPGTKPQRLTETWKGHTNPQGTHRMRVDFDALEPPYPMSLALSASVMDVNRQAWSAETTMLVHPGSVYAGVRFEKSFVDAGEPIAASLLAVDVDGNAVKSRPISVKSARLDWEQTPAGYEEREKDEQTCTVESAEAPVRCLLPTKGGGAYRVTAVVRDEHGRKSQTVARVWVMSRDARPDRGLAEGTVDVIADKKAYGPGESAELLVVAPFPGAEGVVVLARQGILATQRFSMTGAMQTIKVPLSASWTPNVHAVVLLAGAAPRDDDAAPHAPKPAFAQGTADLSIPPVSRTLQVGVTPRDKAVEPAGRTTVDIDVKDAQGHAVAGAEVAFAVVDESILALSAYKLPDPIAAFYPRRSPDIAVEGTRASVTLSKLSDKKEAAYPPPPEEETVTKGVAGDGHLSYHNKSTPPLMAPAPAASAAPAKPRSIRVAELTIDEPMDNDRGGAVSHEKTPIAVRTDFSALAAFEPAKWTDARGHTEATVKLPDSVTRYRVMAVAVARESEFGSAESSITARLPLMVRPSAPRFLNFGDAFELPVVLQNQTDRPMVAGVALRALNATLTEAGGKRLTIPANDRVEARFLAKAEKPGTARFQIGAESGTFADAANVELPVWTPATTEAFATYGVIDQGAIAQPVKMPSGVVTQFGGLEVTTSSTAMQGLTDAVVYLLHYPFECNEQVASRVLSVASLRDVLAAFHSNEIPPPAALAASMTADLEKLKTRQKWDGGWGFWWGEEWPYVSLHVAHALARAETKGYAVDATVKQRALSWLRSVEAHTPAWYPPEVRRALVAYSLYVRRLLKDADPGRARRLLKEYGGADKADLEAIGWIWPTISEDAARGGASLADNARIRQAVANRVTETAGAAHFVTSYGDGDYLLLHSDRRADALLLEAMIVDQPDSDLIPKLVKGLLAQRKAGRWASTQESAFVLLALDGYFEKYEHVTPDFVARVWLGDFYAGDHAFKGRSTDFSEIDVPMSLLADIREGNLTLAKEGAGRLYFRIGMQYAPTDLRPPPVDQGFTVSRTYEAVEEPGDVRKDDGGVWHFKAGKKVRVRVEMVAPARRYHVALVDPMPAGVEPMNPALAVTGSIPADPNAAKSRDPYWYWQSTWYEHQNMRDERAEAFASLVWEGVHEYVYTVRATTPGNFVVSPPKAEEMYSPEVFGRGAGDRVIIE
jgi:uncharacterized protein YfaS (alpha-2-macroglobulin family)